MATQPNLRAAAAPRRALTADEKQAIAKAVAYKLKDPDGAKFIWAPLVVNTRDGVTDYCGLVNGKNSYGGYSGYDKFYVQLGYGAGGKLAAVDVRMIAEANDDISQDATTSICIQYGYGTLSAAAM